MNGLLPFLYLLLNAVYPQDTIRDFCGYRIPKKSLRELFPGQKNYLPLNIFVD